MKYLVTATLMIALGATAAEEPAAIQKVETPALSEPQTLPTLDSLWNKASEGSELKQALVNGTLKAELLLGYEYSDLDDNGRDAANAFLSRTRISYLTGDYRGFSAFVQAQYVGPLNDTFSPKNNKYDTVADPEEFRFHQAYLAYTGYDSHARIGAQEIILDNARFIGNVGWRLNAQSFNAGSIANESVENLKLYYAYADSINQINGETNDDRQYHMFNGEYRLTENNQVSAFAYLQRNDEDGSGPDQLDTFGARNWGQSDNLNYDFMVALQRHAFYGHAFGEAVLDRVNIGGGIEYISGGDDSNDRFQTLNGTAHKFNGWADQFLGTGGGLEAGLIDAYGQVSATVLEKLNLLGVYHYFHTAHKTDSGFDGDYGQEFDLQAKYSVCKNFDVLAKCAYYIKGDNHAGNTTADETVFWLRGTLKF
ncbi:alginate export family protein [Pontiella sulfatireligans]|uniref:Alginate export domain-containing protein n=1 Tax=Pontiella sulfatireligans TaxID=2750658 RepID=A0A6C2UR08_9BACT|nr:alginate export family protein [Pontiella sulfatireligans]VGO22742.1 hypothetical protein SCARR_04838 [Pontiella sulfatireligans]